jgi:DnaJ homolog subfamily C member 28
MNDPARGVDEAIRKAMEDGQFSNLPGKGRPLNLEANAYEDPEWWLAHHLLRENDFTLPWIAERQEIEQTLETSRQAIKRAWHTWKELPAGEITWQRAQAAFREQINLLNKRIRDYNLSVSSMSFQRLPVNADREIELIQVEHD